MKCPILTAGYWSNSPGFATSKTDCLKEECAWWDKDKDMCFRASEVLELRFLRSLVKEMQDKMPR